MPGTERRDGAWRQAVEWPPAIAAGTSLPVPEGLTVIALVRGTSSAAVTGKRT